MRYLYIVYIHYITQEFIRSPGAFQQNEPVSRKELRQNMASDFSRKMPLDQNPFVLPGGAEM